jgi:hypothetical protein
MFVIFAAKKELGALYSQPCSPSIEGKLTSTFSGGKFGSDRFLSPACASRVNA